MKVLVTGGAGYVGSHCVKRLLQKGHEVVVFDNLVYGNRHAVPEEAILVRGDLLDRRRLAANIQENTPSMGVMHFAGLLNVNESISRPRYYYENNVLGSLNLVGEMMNHQIHKLVFSSTCAIYGDPPAVPIVETMDKNPITPYGRTKWIVEMALQDCALQGGLGSTSLRYFNASGAAEDCSIGEAREVEYHLIPLVLQVALGQRDHIKVFGTDYPTEDGTAVRDYVHVLDLAEAHLLALENIVPGQANAFNVGTGTGTSVQQVVEAARAVTGVDIPAEESPRREGDPVALYANSELANKQLGWVPAYTDINEIVRTAWAWHRDHPNGYDD